MYTEGYQDCLAYIDAYWDQIIRKPARRKIDHHVVSIPYTYFVPNNKKFSYIYYWDSYFMFRGLIGTKREWLIRDMVKNFTYLFKKYQIIPNFNAPASMGRSQPPFFTSMILDAMSIPPHIRGHRAKLDKLLPRINKLIMENWTRHAIATAKKEYFHVWIDPYTFYNHRVEGYTLARYGDRDVGYAHSSELESGWDFTSRFYNRCNEFFPIDLNVLLHKYEDDFSFVSSLLHDEEDALFWKRKAVERQQEVQKLMWNEEKGFFFDYNYLYQRQSNFLSLAGFVPLWGGIATEEQAKKVREKLPLFETDHGLTITAKESLAPPLDLSSIPEQYRVGIEEILKPKQWDYPHIWPPVEYLAVVGLLRYGFVDDAKRIMQKSLAMQAQVFRKHHAFFEKIDGVTGKRAGDFHYENQPGFGWTSAVFFRYVKILDFLEEGNEPFLPSQASPPFTLAFPT